MKKYILIFLINCLVTTNIHCLLSEELRTGAKRLKKVPSELKVIPAELNKMYNILEAKIIEANDGAMEAHKGLEESKRSKKDILDRKIPLYMKNKIATALTNLEETLPIVERTLNTVKSNMLSTIKNKQYNLGSINSKLASIEKYITRRFVPARLNGTATILEVVEKTHSTLSNAKQKILAVFKEMQTEPDN